MSRGCSGGLPSLCSIRGSKIPMASVLLRPNREICSPSRRTSTRYSDRIFLLLSQREAWRLMRLDGHIGGMGSKYARGWVADFVMRASSGGRRISCCGRARVDRVASASPRAPSLLYLVAFRRESARMTWMATSDDELPELPFSPEASGCLHTPFRQPVQLGLVSHHRGDLV